MAEASGQEKLSFRTLTRRQWHGLVALLYAFTTMLFCGVLMDSFYPPEGRKHGVSTSLNGVIMSTNPAVSFFTSMIIGMLVAWAGPKTMIMVGVGIYSVSSILFGLLQFVAPLEAFVAGSFILMAFLSFSSTCVYTSVVTLSAKLFHSNISLIIGTTETMFAVAEGVSLLSSGLLFELGGFYVPYVFFGLLHATSLPLCFLLLPEVKSGEDPGDSKAAQGVEEVGKTASEVKMRPWHLMKIPRTMLIACLIPLGGMYWAFMGANLELHLSPLKLNKFQTNLMFLITSFWYGMVCPIVGWSAGKFPKKWPLIAFGLIGSGIGCLFLGPLPIFGLENTVTQNAITLTIVTILQAICTVPAFESVITYTVEAGYPDDVETYALATSLLATTDPIGNFIGAFGGGFMVEAVGFAVSAAIVGAAMFVAGIIIICFFYCCDTDPRGSGRKGSTTMEMQDGSALQSGTEEGYCKRQRDLSV